MTTNCILTYSILDADGNRQSLPVYGQFDETTVTLSALLAYLAVTASDLDAVTDGQIVYQSLTISPPLPGGLKSSPVAGSNVQETGLISFSTATPNRSYGQDIPAFIQAGFDGMNIVLSNAAVETWTDRMVNSGTTIIPTSNFWSTLEGVLRGRKTFRK